MKIIRSIIFCAVATLISVDAQAFLYGNSAVAPDSSSLSSLIDTQNQAFESGSQTPRLLLPVPGSVKSSFQISKVHFIVSDANTLGFDYNDQQFDINNAAKCKGLGFKTETSSCTSAGQNVGQLCPYDQSYTNVCCETSYKYKKAECSYPRTISSSSCNNKYKCYCDTALYPYTSSNCSSPYVLADKCVDDSGSHYAQCECPSYYKPCDSSKNLVGVGAACNRNGETVYAQCECKSAYKYVCEQFGPTNANDYCLSGLKYYKECKTCGNLGFVEGVCPAGIDCSFEQCSGKYYPTGKCTLGYTDISDTSCDWYKYWMPCSEAPEKPESSA